MISFNLHAKLFLIVIFIISSYYACKLLPSKAAAQSAPFRFASWSDAQDGGTFSTNTSNQIAALKPSFTIFNGDLESDGVTESMMDTMASAINGENSNNGLFNKTFFVRGNHDNYRDNSAALWQNYFTNKNKPLPAGVSNYTGMDSNSSYLTYSFDYGNSRFIGIDVPGDAISIKSQQITFLDNRLTDAENKKLTHAFIYFHGPVYCVEDNHCSCSQTTDASCTPAALINVINKHPVVSATFHGHEHILGWTHISSARLSQVKYPYEQFMTSPAGSSPYNSTLYEDRVDYADKTNTRAFGIVDVNGNAFTVSLYRVGKTSPVWNKTFTKSSSSSVITPLITPGSGSYLNLRVFLHGIGRGGDNVNSASTGTANPVHPNRTATLTLIDANNQVAFNKQAGIGFNSALGLFSGLVNISGLKSGLYTARVSVRQYLAKTIPGIIQIRALPGRAEVLPEVRLTTGDTNSDNVLSILDYNQILDCFSELGLPRSCTDSNKKLMTDLTDDGKVNQFDYNLFLRELSVQSGQ